MSGRCTEITLPDGSKAIVRSQKPGWKPSEADIKAIMDLREQLLAICPGCHCYRNRCACDYREQQEGSGGDAILDRNVP
jgi:hypothetical protein